MSNKNRETHMVKNFNTIEVKFKILRRDKVEPEMVIDILIFKGKDGYPFEIFCKDYLTQKERLLFKLLEEERESLYKRFTKNLNNNKQLFVNFITSVEEAPYLFHTTREVTIITKEEVEGYSGYASMKFYIVKKLKGAFQNLINNAKMSGEKE